MDDFDIYADLPDFAWLKQEYEADVDVKKQELPTSEKDIIELKAKLLKLEKVHKLVLSHYSSLWKTAKQERKRMERQIAELRSQLDNLAFKRNHRQTNRNVVPTPVSMLSVNAHPATALQAPHVYQFNHPSPLISQTYSKQQISKNVYSYPPPLMHSTLTTKQEWKQQEDISDKHFVDNLVVSSNVITPENSHSSDESEDDIVKKSEYRSTVYGERLRKKLLEEKRNAARQKQESMLNEKKGNENKFYHQKTEDSENVYKNKNLNASKNKDATSATKEIDIRTVKEDNNNRKPSETDAQSAKVSSKQHELKNENKNNFKDTMKNNELNIESKNDIVRKNKEDSTNRKFDIDKERTDEDFIIKKERDLNKRKQDEQLKIEKERDMERKREDESRIRQERNLERSRKEEEIEKARREEQFEKKRREGEIEKSRKNQEFERKRKEETDKRRREEVDRRRKDEDIERRKKEEIDKRRREETEKRRKEEEIDKRRREEFEKRRKEESERRKNEELDRKRREEIEKKKKEDIDRKKKEEDIEKKKRDDIDRRKREEDAEKKKKEEEQHAKKLKEIEKNRNERQLEELIKERKRIEEEMNNMKDEEAEEGELTESFNDTLCKEQSISKKPQDHKEKLKATSTDKSKQLQKNQSDNRKNDYCKVGARFTRSNSSRVTNQTISDNRRKGYREYAIFKSDRHQVEHISYDKHKHNDLRSRRDQLGRERERRKSSHRNKSRNRNRSNSGHRSDEDRGNYSPKRIKLQEKDRDHRDKLKDTEPNRNSKIIVKTPKRRRSTKSNERSPHNSKKRKMSPEKDLDCNIKSKKNDIQKTNVQTIVDDAKNIIDSSLSNENTSRRAVDSLKNVKDNMKKEKEKLIDSLSKDQDKISNKLTNPPKEDQVENSNEDHVKHADPQADKKGTDHANRMKTLINELFEVQESSIGTSANSKQVKKFEETSNETILSDLEDGEITDSDESTNSDNLPNAAQSQPTHKDVDTMNLFGKNRLEDGNSKNKLTTTLQKNNEEIASKGNSEIKESILYNMLTQSKNSHNKESTKIELHEKISNKNKVVVQKDNNKSESRKEIADKADNTSPQIINGLETSVNKMSPIECRVNESNKTIETSDANKNVLSEINENKTSSEPSDKINTIIEKEKQSNGEKIEKNNMDVKKTGTENSTKCVSISTASNILLEHLPQNCLKINNSENKIVNKEKSHVKRTELHNETNTMKNACLKENLEIKNDCIKKHIGQKDIVIDERLHEESSKPIVKLESPSQDNATEKIINTSQTKVSLTAVKKVIVIRRRRRPVQLSDSPPVVVINNLK